MIRLTVQAKDYEVEQLLSHLNVQSGEEVEDSISLLERTLRWLRAAQERAYDVMPDPEAIFQIAVGDNVQSASPLSRKPSGRPSRT